MNLIPDFFFDERFHCWGLHIPFGLGFKGGVFDTVITSEPLLNHFSVFMDREDSHTFGYDYVNGVFCHLSNFSVKVFGIIYLTFEVEPIGKKPREVD